MFILVLNDPLFSPHSADERFDATFHTNVLVNATGSCQYIPPGATFIIIILSFTWSCLTFVLPQFMVTLSVSSPSFASFHIKTSRISITVFNLLLFIIIILNIDFPNTSLQAFWRVPATLMFGGSHLMYRSVIWSLAPGPTTAGCWTSKWLTWTSLPTYPTGSGIL